MIICFDCSGETKRQLDSLVSAADYADYSEAIAAAVANQALLTQRVAKAGALVIESGDDDQGKAPSVVRDKASPPNPFGSARMRAEERGPAGIPRIFAMANLDDVAIDFANPRTNGADALNEVPANRWLWGQFNRFLPAKASCRALARLQSASPSGVLLADAATTIAEAAADLGDYLAAYDMNQNLKRDDAMSTAFPRSGRDTWKAQQRYATQFVGSVNREGIVSGMLIDLKLVNWDGPRDSVKLRLTEAGWRLGRLWNPILDSVTAEPARRLSDEETRLLVAHIRNAVRQEDFAYRFLMHAVYRGSNSPLALDAALAAANRDMTSAFVSTQRSGAVARMADLGLLARVRSGPSVMYEITEAGRAYLDS